MPLTYSTAMPFLLKCFMLIDKIDGLPSEKLHRGISPVERRNISYFSTCTCPSHSYLRNIHHSVGLASSRITKSGTRSHVPVIKCTFPIKCKFFIWKYWIECYFKKEFQLVKFSVIKKFRPRIVAGFEPTFLLLWIGCVFIHCKHFLQCLSFWEHILMALLAGVVLVFLSKVIYLNFIIAKEVGPCFYFNF